MAAASSITRRKQVRDETFKLLIENGLTGWKVRYNSRMTRALGRCIPSQKTIEYQPRYMAQNDWAQVRTTVLHEVAHAIAITKYGHFMGGGHGATWARIARELGLENPSAINHTANLTAKFTGTCGGCNGTWQRNRRVHGAICPPCRRKYTSEVLQNGSSEQRYSITWKRND